MNLNGKKETKTILNGKPLYDYDLNKKENYLKHIFNHEQNIKKSRNLSNINNKDKEKKQIILLSVFVVIILVYILLLIMNI